MVREVITRQSAKALGLKRYFTGKPCSRGHVAERFVGNCTCSACHDEWKRDNRDKVAAADAKWRRENPRKTRKWDRENPEKRKAAGKRYRDANRGQRIAKARAWREENPDKMALSAKRWRAKNRAKCAALGMKRQAAKINATPPWADFDAIKMFYDLAKQAERMVPGDVKFHVDHIVPLQGKNVCGLHVPWNLQVLEATENMSKGNRFKSIGAGA
jgi:hypothetical protein